MSAHREAPVSRPALAGYLALLWLTPFGMLTTLVMAGNYLPMPERVWPVTILLLLLPALLPVGFFETRIGAQLAGKPLPGMRGTVIGIGFFIIIQILLVIPALSMTLLLLWPLFS